MQQRIISLGGICEVAYQIKLHTDKQDADYFDWLITPYDALIRAIDSNFLDFFKSDDLAVSSDGSSVINTSTGIHYFHDFPLDEDRKLLPNFLDHYDAARSKFEHLKRKFLGISSFDGRVIFIRRDLTRDTAVLLHETLRNKFPTLEFQLISVNSEQNVYHSSHDKDIICINVPRTGPDGLGHADPWCEALKQIGLTDTGFKKTYPQIVRAGKHHIFE